MPNNKDTQKEPDCCQQCWRKKTGKCEQVGQPTFTAVIQIDGRTMVPVRPDAHPYQSAGPYH